MSAVRPGPWPSAPGPAHPTFVHQVADLVTPLAAGEQPSPSSAEGPAFLRIPDAVGRRAGNR